MSTSIHRLAIPSSTRYLLDVRQFVLLHLGEAGVKETVALDVKLAVDEACANVIEHAYRNDPNHKLDVILRIDAGQITVRIRDFGIPFDKKSYREPNVRALTKSGKSGGLGVRIIRRLMDKVEYSTGGQANEILLTKHRQILLPGG